MDAPEEAFDPLSDPRYRENISYLFVELLVIDTIAPLDDEMTQWVTSTLRCGRDDWRDMIKRIAHLSPTFEVAVLDLWYRNSAIAREQGEQLRPADYARLFVDNYNAPNSLVDVWGPGALEDAWARIRAAEGRLESDS